MPDQRKHHGIANYQIKDTNCGILYTVIDNMADRVRTMI